MRAAIRGLETLDDHHLAHPSVYQPKDPTNFAVTLRLYAGAAGGNGQESFDFTVCTPRWLANDMRRGEVRLVRHHVLVSRWDWVKLEDWLRGFVVRCEGRNWSEVASKLSRLGYWEFEDYESGE